MKTVSIIRDRGQLTIPDSIRKKVSWLNPLSTVTISTTNPNEITITPHKNKVSKDEIWKMIKKSQAIKGSGNTSTIEFLDLDRNSH